MRLLASAVAITALITASACTDPVLEQRLADLETKVQDMEGKVATGGRAPGAASAEDEKAAAELAREAQELVAQMKFDEAKEKISELTAKYGTTRAARSSARLVDELAIIGKDAGSLDVEEWFTDSKTSFDDGKATLVVFWEVWCPHCRREVPQINAVKEKYGKDGLNIVAVTKLTKSATKEKVEEFMSENNLSFPIAKEKGDLSARFGVRGIPAAAVVKDGKIVWRGHPARLNDTMYKAWLEG